MDSKDLRAVLEDVRGFRGYHEFLGGLREVPEGLKSVFGGSQGCIRGSQRIIETLRVRTCSIISERDVMCH